MPDFLSAPPGVLFWVGTWGSRERDGKARERQTEAQIKKGREHQTVWVKSAHSSTVLRDVSRPQIWAANEEEKREGGGGERPFHLKPQTREN